jgi:hypothetical protein
MTSCGVVYSLLSCEDGLRLAKQQGWLARWAALLSACIAVACAGGLHCCCQGAVPIVQHSLCPNTADVNQQPHFPGPMVCHVLIPMPRA